MTIHPLDHLLPEQTFANLHSPPSDQPNITGFKPHKGLSMENDGFKSQVSVQYAYFIKTDNKNKKNGGKKLEKKREKNDENSGH